MIAHAPAKWSQVSLKFLFSDRSIGSWGLEPENGDGVVCIRAADFETHQLRHSKKNLTKRKYAAQDIQNRQLQPGDLIIEKSGGGDNQPVGRVVSFDLNQTALCSNFLERLRPDKDILYPRYGAYLFYFLWSTNLVIPFVKQTTGIQNLDINSYLSQEVRIPSVETQKSIADYLDEKTAVIDQLITAKKHLLKLLDEKRRALITHAVTGGLDPNVPLRDSGVEWIGRVPEHWEIASIKYTAEVGNGSTPKRDNKDYWENGTFPWLTSTVVNENIVQEPTQFVTELALRECHLPIVPAQSVLVAITGQGKTRGNAALLPYQATINQHMVYISPRQRILNPEYLNNYLFGVYEVLRMISEGSGSTRGAITVQQIAEFPILLPPLSEQQEIVHYLDQETAKLDKLKQALQKTIALLQERRTALIAAAVSGQLPVAN